MSSDATPIALSAAHTASGKIASSRLISRIGMTTGSLERSLMNKRYC